MKHRRKWWIGGALVGLTVLGLGLAATDAQAMDAPPLEIPTATGLDGEHLLEELLNACDLDPQWTTFFAALSDSETSGTFTSNVCLGDPSLYPSIAKPSPMVEKYGTTEARAAVDAYARAVEAGRFANCPWPERDYVFGSGGWWSLIPSNAWAAYIGTDLICRHPHYVLHPVDQTICAIEMARRLMARSSFKANPNFLSLRVGWGRPTLMGDHTRREETRVKFRDNVEGQGRSASWLDSTVPPLRKFDVRAQWDELMRRFFT